ncbi:hypothetical protein V1477_021010 [Vespula maculifrons]|uniref:Uncharacterized protein n=1 Tax=Vespula maculifrons TaxID=7453 RepID=A0ABD2ANV0_VESMC
MRCRNAVVENRQYFVGQRRYKVPHNTFYKLTWYSDLCHPSAWLNIRKQELANLNILSLAKSLIEAVHEYTFSNEL